MKVERSALPGVLIIVPDRFKDGRGFFSESWNYKSMKLHGVDMQFVQDNHSLSASLGTIRGLHFQAPPFAQAKLVRCGRGRLFDVVVDIRVGSPTYGKWMGEELSFENGKQLYIPTGFLHGFVTREPNTEIVYKCSNYYSPECDGSVRFDDPDINVDWGVGSLEPVLSEKDASAPLLKGFNSPFVFEGS
ncbi:dTDP-4-dehydrorhamnose 3,5-epimerase [Ruegeria atlantica]|uniref:dTDP-4-dehydrorhamnose 3,5-epimerase n=1 Tax=Ruegeria atlantica TaxID=81569 RepID=UPI002495162D|nr:dTDP-4-dehydrorhamnose 3,5-epimerase [Ruegeria atlantica]